jgi:Na+/H+ antiporter NhaD/arsenite permease-like protein
MPSMPRQSGLAHDPGAKLNLSELPAVELLGHDVLDWGIVAVFGIVYLGMVLGGLPRLKLDRSGVALLGAIAVIAFTGQPVDEAARAVNLPTIVLLFALMLLSAQMRRPR